MDGRRGADAAAIGARRRRVTRLNTTSLSPLRAPAEASTQPSHVRDADNGASLAANLVELRVSEYDAESRLSSRAQKLRDELSSCASSSPPTLQARRSTFATTQLPAGEVRSSSRSQAQRRLNRDARPRRRSVWRR